MPIKRVFKARYTDIAKKTNLGGQGNHTVVQKPDGKLKKIISTMTEIPMASISAYSPDNIKVTKNGDFIFFRVGNSGHADYRQLYKINTATGALSKVSTSPTIVVGQQSGYDINDDGTVVIFFNYSDSNYLSKFQGSSTTRLIAHVGNYLQLSNNGSIVHYTGTDACLYRTTVVNPSITVLSASTCAAYSVAKDDGLILWSNSSSSKWNTWREGIGIADLNIVNTTFAPAISRDGRLAAFSSGTNKLYSLTDKTTATEILGGASAVLGYSGRNPVIIEGVRYVVTEVFNTSSYIVLGLNRLDFISNIAMNCVADALGRLWGYSTSTGKISKITILEIDI